MTSFRTARSPLTFSTIFIDFFRSVVFVLNFHNELGVFPRSPGPILEIVEALHGQKGWFIHHKEKKLKGLQNQDFDYTNPSR